MPCTSVFFISSNFLECDMQKQSINERNFKKDNYGVLYNL